MGEEWASQYVAGIQTFDTHKFETHNLGMLSSDLGTRNDGSLYRTDRYGRIVLKGLPVSVWNPRYNGPIEKGKENARRASIARAVDYMSDRVDTFSETIDGYMEDLTEIALDILEETI